jgi:hypothetical protein
MTMKYSSRNAIYILQKRRRKEIIKLFEKKECALEVGILEEIKVIEYFHGKFV